MAHGTVLWFDDAKGYGFVAAETEAAPAPVDVYVHYTQILTDGPRSLQAGQRVELELSAGGRGPQADRVRVVD